jgi:hypothetical protein
MLVKPRLLFTVEHAFEVKGRGLVLTPGICPKGDEKFRKGDRVELRKPASQSHDQDHRTFIVSIDSLELPSPNPSLSLLPLFSDLRSHDVPIGTEVWSVHD